jgi:hypothetical protein
MDSAAVPLDGMSVARDAANIGGFLLGDFN